MIIINKKSVKFEIEQLCSYQNQFENFNLFICQNLFDNSLKDFIDIHLLKAEFIEFIHKGKEGQLVGQELIIPNDAALPKILNFYLNHKDVINMVRDISGIKEIKSFNGRVYKFENNKNSYDKWHNDMDHGRLLGMSLNLSNKPYGGGDFILRDFTSKQIFKTVQHNQWGSAHFFNISNELEHKVNKVSGENPRIAFAGWFNNQPLFK